jgi:sodium/bile acid cotransporter 7
MSFVKKYWFMVGLGAVSFITVADNTQILAGWGNWLKQRHAADIVIVLIFIFSGLALTPEQLKSGLTDVKGVLLALAIIFIIAPLIAALFGLIPMNTGIIIGLFLVAVMPSTLSSGVVMTAAAGGNAAHALVTTIIANSAAAFTIPYTLTFLLQVIGESASITIDKTAMMLKIFLLVVLPLAGGLLLKFSWKALYERIRSKLNIINQTLIIFIVWIALSQTRDILLNSGITVGLIIVLVFVYHGVLLICGWGLIRACRREKGNRESILFMGGQKTLSLSIILQVSLFPQYGIALLVCVIHHIVHLVIDGYLVERLKSVRSRNVS